MLPDKNEKCLKEANNYLHEAAKAIGFEKGMLTRPGDLMMTADMLGSISTDHFRACMTPPAPKLEEPKSKIRRHR